jgi:hypothetical protein
VENIASGGALGYDLYSWPNIIRVIKSRMMKWAGLVVRRGERSCAWSVLVGNLSEIDRLDDIRVHRRVIFK